MFVPNAICKEGLSHEQSMPHKSVAPQQHAAAATFHDPLGGNVNPGFINHGLLIRGYSPNSDNLLLKWYPPPIQQLFGVY